jgi:hypothetical protein
VNVRKLRQALADAEATQGTEHMLVRVAVHIDGRERLLDINTTSVATYRDGGESNHVVYLVTSPVETDHGG